ncbi:hypothetical protein KM043_005839 [Ampulex compressa]|nr:hypothetical protein KM043_005839 [Ampulex compressa]
MEFKVVVIEQPPREEQSGGEAKHPRFSRKAKQSVRLLQARRTSFPMPKARRCLALARVRPDKKEGKETRRGGGWNKKISRKTKLQTFDTRSHAILRVEARHPLC